MGRRGAESGADGGHGRRASDDSGLRGGLPSPARRLSFSSARHILSARGRRYADLCPRKPTVKRPPLQSVTMATLRTLAATGHVVRKRASFLLMLAALLWRVLLEARRPR